MFNKAVQRMGNFKDIPPEELRSITALTLVVCGDSDVMRPEHAVEEFRLLRHAQLAILPLTDHMKVTSRTSWLVPMVEWKQTKRKPADRRGPKTAFAMICSCGDGESAEMNILSLAKTGS